jgi:hypothetical protein
VQVAIVDQRKNDVAGCIGDSLVQRARTQGVEIREEKGDNGRVIYLRAGRRPGDRNWSSPGTEMPLVGFGIILSV